MNQKGFANIVLVILVVVLAGTAGYFILTKKPTMPKKEGVNETSNLASELTQSFLGDCVIRPRTPSPDKSKAANITNSDAVYPDLIDLKFKEGSGVRLRNGKFVSLCGADLTQLNNVVFADSSIQPQRLFTRSEEDLTQEYEKTIVKNPNVADLNLWYRLRIRGNTDHQKLQNLIRRLNSFDIVEIATTISKPVLPP